MNAFTMYKFGQFGKSQFQTVEKKMIHDKLEQGFKPGDIIEFKSLFHSHWGVYVGDGKIIHFRQVGKVSLYDILVGRRLTMVERKKLELVEEKGKPCRNNVMDGVYEPRNPDEIVRIALTMRRFSPNQAQDFLNKVHNSKEFALYCRYQDLPKSNETTLRTTEMFALAGIMGFTTRSILRHFRAV